MKMSWKMLILPMMLAAALCVGSQAAPADTQDPNAQAGASGTQESNTQTGVSGTQGSNTQTGVSGTQSSNTQTGSSGAQVPYVQSEPSLKRGLQEEDGFLFYYDSNGYRATGWMEIKGDFYYFCPNAADAPVGSAATGILTIGADRYYFDDEGVLQTGWQTVDGTRCYCAPEGEAGEIGKLYTGLQLIDGNRYFFEDDGAMKIGWVTYGKKTYFFNRKKKSAKYGAAYTGWNTIGKEKYYFTAKGVMKKNRWISKKYYVGADGKMLKNCVTPDGYYVDSKGVKGKQVSGFVKVGGKVYCYVSGEMMTGLKKIGKNRYYFKENGARKEKGWVTVDGDKYYIQKGVVQTGWVVCKGKRYYFSAKGKLVTNKTVDGVAIGADGVAPVSVLLLSGHGQGDPGASATYGSTYYREDLLTRQFSTLIYNQLKSTAPGMSVTMYDQNYDCYQVLAGQKTGPKPNFKAYDYVLEIHFNATGYSEKDSNGNGSCKGTCIYVNSAKTDTTLDARIVAAVTKAAGLPIRGGGTGVMRSSGLLNARTVQGQGVSYGLLETVYIDDRDDITVYNKYKKAMAKAAATAIREYFGVEAAAPSVTDTEESDEADASVSDTADSSAAGTADSSASNTGTSPAADE